MAKTHAEYQKQYRLKMGDAYRKKEAARMRAWRALHSQEEEFRNRHNEQNKKYREANRERINNKRRNDSASKERNAARMREWRKNNRELDRKRQRVKEKIRRARMRIVGEFSLGEWKSICEKYGNKCLRCGKAGDYEELTIDHIVPVSLGGLCEAHNIQPLCFDCNTWKSNRVIDFRPKEQNHGNNL